MDEDYLLHPCLLLYDVSQTCQMGKESYMFSNCQPSSITGAMEKAPEKSYKLLVNQP